jgi:hypothetical protein
MRRIFGSEKVVRKQFNRNNSLNNQSSSFRDSKMGDQFGSVEASEIDESIFERSTYENFIDKKYQELYKVHISEYKHITQSLEQQAERKKNKYKALFLEKKISSHSFDRELKGIEKWENSKKKQIKKKQKNIIQVLGFLQKDQFDLQNFKNSIMSPDESRVNTRNLSSIMVDDSADSINLNKIEMSDFQCDRLITPIRDMNSSKLIKGADIMNNSHLSVVNSTINNISKANRSMHKTHDSNMSINSSRCVKVVLEKDKHMYSIVPFEYKSKLAQESSLESEEIKIEKQVFPEHKEFNEIVIKNSCIKIGTQAKPNLFEKRKKSKRRIQSTSSPLRCQISPDLNCSQTSSQSNTSITKNAKKEVTINLEKPENLDSARDKPKIIKVKNHSYESPKKGDNKDWDFKLPFISFDGQINRYLKRNTFKSYFK